VVGFGGGELGGAVDIVGVGWGLCGLGVVPWGVLNLWVWLLCFGGFFYWFVACVVCSVVVVGGLGWVLGVWCGFVWCGRVWWFSVGGGWDF